jgi:hypothetical protein
MSGASWEHIILAAIAALPATIAAVSSVRNGRVLRNGYAHGDTKSAKTGSGESLEQWSYRIRPKNRPHNKA